MSSDILRKSESLCRPFDILPNGLTCAVLARLSPRERPFLGRLRKDRVPELPVKANLFSLPGLFLHNPKLRANLLGPQFQNIRNPKASS
jgi:hypothetical protein